VIGPGVVVAWRLTQRADPLERTIIPLGAGLVTAGAVAHLLGTFGALRVFPWLAAALTGVAVSLLWERLSVQDPRAQRGLDRHTITMCALVVIVAASAGAVAYAKRLTVTPDRVTINGNYDSYDSSYYAAMSSELATHVPPASPFQAGHQLNYSFHTQLVLGMVHRFGDVPLVDLYFRYAWPILLVMMALTAFMFVRRIAGDGVAAFAVCLLLLGSDFSYVPGFFLQGKPYWDNLLWSTNWMTPSAEMLFFNPWTTALCVLFLGLWSLVHAEEADENVGIIASCICFGSLIEYKPFAFVLIIGALAAAAMFYKADARDRRRLVVVLAGSVFVAVPYLNEVLLGYGDSQSVLVRGVGYISVLPTIVMRQLNLGPVVTPVATALGGGWMNVVMPIVVANVLFVLGGIGLRLLGVPRVWRALRPRSDERPIWRLMAWMIVGGAMSALVVVTQPYHQTFQCFHVSLYLLWIFVAKTVLERTALLPARRLVAVGVVMLLAVPSTFHYLGVKWHDDEHAYAVLDRDALAIVDSLQRTDPERTMVLGHYPDNPSFIAVLAERRTVLAWARYARNSGAVRADIDRLFRSADDPASDPWTLLAQHRVTHVVEAVGRDRIRPDFLASLQPVLVTPTYRLYAVPQ
jgi:hypothetical protein